MSTRYKTSRIVLSCLLLFVGCLFLLLMNGQLFTNQLVFLGFCAASGLLWLGPAREQRLAQWVIVVHAAVILATLIMLPGSYEFQKKFNAGSEAARP